MVNKIPLLLLMDFFVYLSHSEQEARMKIYSVSTRCYFAFGALVSEELSYKLKGINVFPLISFWFS